MTTALLREELPVSELPAGRSVDGDGQAIGSRSGPGGLADGRSVDEAAGSAVPLLELRDVHKSYYLGKEEFPVLQGLDLSVGRGEFVSLLGESGGGKSTLMNIIGGLDREYRGDVLVDGVAQKSKREKDMDTYRRDTVGFIFQAFNLVPYLSVLDNILISLKMTDLTERQRRRRAIRLATQMGLGRQLRKRPSQLSGGQKQRVAIARALAADPEIILADEPTGALDSQNTAEVLAILREIAQSGKTVIVVTHSQEVAAYGTRVIRLADGRIAGDERLKPPYRPPESVKPFDTKPLTFSDTFRTAFKHFGSAWKLNLLIETGTAIGLFAVIFFLGLGTGGTAYLNAQVSQLANPNMVLAAKRAANNQGKDNDVAWQNSFVSMGKDLSAQVLSPAELDRLKGLEHVKSVQPMYNLVGQVGFSYGKNVAGDTSINTWASVYQATSLDKGTKPGKGQIVVVESVVRALDPHVYQKKDWQAFIGKRITVSLTLTGPHGPVQISQPFTVSGVLQQRTALGSSLSVVSADSMKALLAAHDLPTQPSMAVVEADDSRNVQAVVTGIQGLRDGGQRVFATQSIGSLLTTVNNITTIVSAVLAAIAGISLVVSVFMIVVTTYMSVAERTKEIGIIRALGGRKKDISRLFTAESLLIGLSSAAIAVGLALVGQAVINAVLKGSLGGVAIVQITPLQVAVAVGLAVVIALLSSLAPAGRAARLNTIEALAEE